MKNNKQNAFGGLLLIILGSSICLIVGFPFLLSIFACFLGLYLINVGLQLLGQPPLTIVVKQIIDELHSRFF